MMNDFDLTPDDPRLTAYALGEITGDERAVIEAALRENPALRALVDDIRATTAQIEAALAAEARGPLPGEKETPTVAREINGEFATLPAGTNAARDAAPVSAGSAAGDDPYPLGGAGPKLLRFPQIYYVIGTMAAACFAVMVALRDDKPRLSQAPMADRRIVREVLLPPPSVDRNASAVTASTSPETAGRVTEKVKEEALAKDQLATTPITVPLDGRRLPDAANTAQQSPSNLEFNDNNLALLNQARRDEPGQAPMLQEQNAVVNFGPSIATETDQLKAVGDPVMVPAGNTFAPMRNAPLNLSTTLGANSSAKTPSSAVRSRALMRGSGAGAAPNPGAESPVAVTQPTMPPATWSGDASKKTMNSGITGTIAGGAVALTESRNEVVKLDAFTVSTTREGFAASAASAANRVAEREKLPAPPAGAKFARNTEAYAYTPDNDFLSAAQNPLSTFSVDVDTASYSNVRRMIDQGRRPPRDAVRIEELLNYFPYRYSAPKVERNDSNTAPVAASLEVADAPWSPTHRLVRIGLKAREVSTAERGRANLVFLLDVSGSMDQANRLPLVKESMRLLVGKLRPDDHVAIVVYAGASGLALPSTPVARASEILEALDALTPGGSTNGAMGIQLAYDIAKANFVPGGINRVILCTDGDFNVGTTNEGDLVRLIGEKASTGVYLTVLGFGIGNYKDATLEKLADKGNGNYGYIDTRREAEKMLVEQVSGTLVTVAKDVKVQVEFNPAKVASYRLIGYENRLLKKEDFNDDKIDAGEIGAGHTVTALYEVVPVGIQGNISASIAPVDDLKYATTGAVSSRLATPTVKSGPPSNELLTVKVRYKKPDAVFSFSKKLEFPLVDAGGTYERASADLRFAAAVAEFGMILRDSPHKGAGTMEDVVAWATQATSTPADDPSGYRAEFIALARKAEELVR